MREMVRRVGIAAVVFLFLVSPAVARGPGGGGGPSGGGAPGGAGNPGNAGGAVRGLERAEDEANPQGVQHGIDNAEKKINKKKNPRNPNTQTSEDTDTRSSKPSPTGGRANPHRTHEWYHSRLGGHRHVLARSRKSTARGIDAGPTPLKEVRAS